MENKLQELTQKLYAEGLYKGQQEAEQLLSDAEAKAAKIIAEANTKAEGIIAAANNRAQEIAKNSLTELTLSGKMVVNTIKQQIEKLILFKGVVPTIAQVNSDPKFISELLLTVAANWSANSGSKVELKATLPEAKKAELNALAQQAIAKSLKDGLEINFDSKVKSGFVIGPKDGSYYINFSDEDFNALFNEYLRPQISEMLFSEKA